MSSVIADLRVLAEIDLCSSAAAPSLTLAVNSDITINCPLSAQGTASVSVIGSNWTHVKRISSGEVPGSATLS